MALEGIKHLIDCHCVLPQFRNIVPTFYHKFVVFSVIDGDKVEPKFVQCNNCSVVHKIVDICKSEIVAGLDFSSAITTLDEIKPALPDNIAAILDKNKCDLATWENVLFKLDNFKEGFEVPIAREENLGLVQVKILVVNEKGNVRVKSESRNEYLETKI